ncbi:MAG TPA: right-handed parallel beta-helix repeat-containing protein, partial [Kiritimatiellia bacterium]|nr:right-handed parallel beta-helix repeat-containing protein [Kiritimatiellia bacterium]
MAANASSRGLYSRKGSPTIWRSGVLWSNAVGVYVDDGKLTFENSVIGAFGSGNYAFFNKESAATNQIMSDYNNIWLQDDALAGYYDAYPSTSPDDRVFVTLSRWTRDTGLDQHSLSHDPGFAAAVSNDFHLLSPAGRFIPGSGFETNEAEGLSVLVDAGSPASAYTNEPAPNGMRINIGMYGNTVQASQTPTNSRLTAVSLNDGGRVEGIRDLVWVASGDVTGHTVFIEFSANGGVTWTTLVTGVSASAGVYSWDTTAYPSTPLGVWRITSEDDASVTDQTETLFAVRNGPLNFYVNDVVTNGDVFCSSTGAVEHTGVFPNDPKSDVQDVLDTYDLEPGDTIWLDTGSYTLTNSITMGIFDMGEPTNRVVVRGSTNMAAGGSVLGNFGFNLTGLKGIELRDMKITNSAVGVYVSGSSGMLLHGLEAVGCTNGFQILGSSSEDVTLRQCAARGGQQGLYVQTSASVTWENGLLWSNAYGVYLNQASLDFRNSVVGALKAGQYAFYYRPGSLTSDYNVVYLTNGAYAGNFVPTSGGTITTYENVSRWVRGFGFDRHSLSHAPGFYSAASNDFHALSPAGRYVSGSGYMTNAAEALSILVDSGDPLSDVADETLPNGSRINIGRYGGSGQSSLSPTNARLIAVSLNDGGRAEGVKELTWVASGDATGHTVSIEFSHDAGVTWTTLVSAVTATDESWTWDTTQVPSTPVGVWRVTSVADPSVSDTNDTLFAVRNDPLFFYVNDSSTNGDVYCSAAGTNSNTGAFSNAPKASVQDVISTYDLEPGDTIYVDTGNYPLTASIQPGVFDAGSATNRISLIGSTNYASGGTRFTGYGIDMNAVGGWALRHFAVSGAAKGVRLFQADDVLVEWVQTYGGVFGFEINDCERSVLRHCAAFGNSAQGVYNRKGYDTIWDHGVVWSNLYGIYMDEGSMQVQNTVIGAFGSGRRAYYYRERSVSDVFDCDYNNIYLTDGAYAGYLDSLAGTDYDIIYENASRWIRDFGVDRHSLSHDPLFADAANRDFHLQTQAPDGRYVHGLGFATNDLVTSPLIDAGNPLSDASSEPHPSGARVNIGLYGNSDQASQTPTNSMLTVVSLSSGGRVEGISDLVWVASGDVTGHTVTIEYSSNGGLTWTTLVSGVDASISAWTWDTTQFEDSAIGQWRITSEDDPAVSDTNDVLFAVRNAPLAFYVNDLSDSGDIYTSVIGNSTNNGLSPLSPQISVQYILDAYDLEPGDTIYVDTGSYTLTSEIIATLQDSGAATNFVSIQGSTSDVSRTIFTAFGVANAFTLDDVWGFVLRNMTIRNASTAGVYMNRAWHSGAEWVICENSGRDGFRVRESVSTFLNHCIARASIRHGVWNESSPGTEWINGIVWSNVNGINIEGGSIKVENSVLSALNSQQQAYRYVAGVLTSDYNNIYRKNGGFAGIVVAEGIYTTKYDSASSWTATFGYDGSSLSSEPGFWNADGGDYHLRSPAGRYQPGSGFVTNPLEGASLLIDAGNPSTPVGDEPEPNAGRINVGLYGGTGQASMTYTSAVLSVSSFDDGGYVTGTVSLVWLARGAATNHTVQIDFSANGGVAWTTLVTGIDATLGTWTWDTTAQMSTPLGVWRVTSIEEPLVSDQNAVFFAVRNAPFHFYVNDNSTTGDVYTLVKGSDAYSGLTVSDPMASLKTVIDTYDLEAGDTIWVDTGTYPLSEDITIGTLDSGTTNIPVMIRGSTNAVYGGSVLDRQVPGGGTAGIRFNGALGVVIKDLGVKRAENGVVFENATRACRAEGVTSFDNGSAGFSVSLSKDILMQGCLAINNSTYGVRASGGVMPTSYLWENGVIWQSGTAVYMTSSTANQFRNSLLQGSGAGARVYDIGLGASLVSDYNNFAITNNAILVEKRRSAGGSEIHNFVSSWAFASGQDRHSLSHVPLFADADSWDFHLKSAQGRYEPGTGYATNDAPGVYSPMLDTGDPSSVFTNETAPRGPRINMGLYGNTGQSSLSRTNAWLLAITLNGAGAISGTQDIYWAYGNIDTSETVRLEYSLNGGIEYFTLATNIPVSQESVSWDVSEYNNTARGLWKVVLESDPAVYDAVDNEFSIRNQTRIYYVNDTNTAGDVYVDAGALGSPTNTGLTADSPMDSP